MACQGDASHLNRPDNSGYSTTKERLAADFGGDTVDVCFVQHRF
jgi:hypothetical protein